MDLLSSKNFLAKIVCIVAVLGASTSCSSEIASSPTTPYFSVESQVNNSVIFQTNEIKYEEEVVLLTHFKNISMTEFFLPSFGRGYGGAISKFKDFLLVATSSGEFLQVDLLKKTIATSPFLQLKMGEAEFDLSKRISYSETLPRVHDLVVDGEDIYVSYDRYDPSVDGIKFVISKNAGNGSWIDVYVSEVLESPLFTLGSGGAMTIDPSRRSLFFSVGDFSLDTARGLESDFAAQSDKLPWGHILKLDLKSLDVDLYSKGHRNVLGLLFIDKLLLSSEMGPKGGDEINSIVQGRNYGWPYQSFGTKYDSFIRFEPPEDVGSTDFFTEPIWVFINSVAPTQMIESSFFGSMKNSIVMGSLIAESLFSFRYINGRVQFMEQIPVNSRVRDLIEVGNQIVVLTDNGSIKVLG